MQDYILTQVWRGHRAGGQLQLSDRDAEKLIAAGIVQPIPAVVPPEPDEPTNEPEAEATSDKPKKTKGGAK